MQRATSEWYTLVTKKITEENRHNITNGFSLFIYLLLLMSFFVYVLFFFLLFPFLLLKYFDLSRPSYSQIANDFFRVFFFGWFILVLSTITLNLSFFFVFLVVIGFYLVFVLFCLPSGTQERLKVFDVQSDDFVCRCSSRTNWIKTKRANEPYVT